MKEPALLKGPEKLFCQTEISPFLPRGKYLKVNIKKIANDPDVNDDYFFLESPDDPSEIEIP